MTRATFGAVLFLVLAACSGSSNVGSSDGRDALVGRTCEIHYDIARDAADGVDTLTETRDRTKDLYDGYGQGAPSDIASALRDIVASLTRLDPDALESALQRMTPACSSRGF